MLTWSSRLRLDHPGIYNLKLAEFSRTVVSVKLLFWDCWKTRMFYSGQSGSIQTCFGNQNDILTRGNYNDFRNSND